MVGEGFVEAEDLKISDKLLLSSGKCVTIEEIQVKQRYILFIILRLFWLSEDFNAVLDEISHSKSSWDYSRLARPMEKNLKKKE